MSVDFAADFLKNDNQTDPKFKNESEEMTIENYDVTLTAHYEKTVSVCADSPEQAAEKVKIILFDTDLIEFSNEDFVCGEADIIEHSEDGLDDIDEEELSEEDDCSDCPYFCPVCGECLYEDECEE